MRNKILILIGLVLLAVLGVFYYSQHKTAVQTREDLQAKRDQISALLREKKELEGETDTTISEKDKKSLLKVATDIYGYGGAEIKRLVGQRNGILVIPEQYKIDDVNSISAQQLRGLLDNKWQIAVNVNRKDDDAVWSWAEAVRDRVVTLADEGYPTDIYFYTNEDGKTLTQEEADELQYIGFKSVICDCEVDDKITLEDVKIIKLIDYDEITDATLDSLKGYYGVKFSVTSILENELTEKAKAVLSNKKVVFSPMENLKKVSVTKKKKVDEETQKRLEEIEEELKQLYGQIGTMMPEEATTEAR